MKEWIERLKGTPKGKTLLKLSLYMIFFFAVLILCIVGVAMDSPYNEVPTDESSESTEIVEPPKDLTFLEKQTILYDGQYNFTYKIEGMTNLSYYGEFDSGITNGFKETEDELIRYSIENKEVYKHTLTEKEPYSELYESLDEELLDFKKLFSKLNVSSSTIKKSSTDKIYTYDLEDGSYEVVTNFNNITAINIKTKDIEYKFSFEY